MYVHNVARFKLCDSQVYASHDFFWLSACILFLILNRWFISVYCFILHIHITCHTLAFTCTLKVLKYCIVITSTSMKLNVFVYRQELLSTIGPFDHSQRVQLLGECLGHAGGVQVSVITAMSIRS